MSTINMVKNIKQIHKEDILLVKIGKFYNSYGKDAYIISDLFSYKMKQVENNIYVCGFPDVSLNKVEAKLEREKINYILLDKRNNYEKDEESNNGNLNNYNKAYEKAKNNISYKIRIENINKFLIQQENKEELKEILQQMEKIINERRKI